MGACWLSFSCFRVIAFSNGVDISPEPVEDSWELVTRVKTLISTIQVLTTVLTKFHDLASRVISSTASESVCFSGLQDVGFWQVKLLGLLAPTPGEVESLLQSQLQASLLGIGFGLTLDDLGICKGSAP